MIFRLIGSGNGRQIQKQTEIENDMQTELIQPDSTATYVYKFKSDWDWIPSDGNIFDIVLKEAFDQIPSLGAKLLNPKYAIALDITEITNIVAESKIGIPIVNFKFEPSYESTQTLKGPGSYVSVPLYVGQTKVQNHLFYSIDRYMSVLAFAGAKASPVGAILGVAAIIDSHIVYKKAFDPQPNYTEVVQPEPFDVPEIDSLPNGTYKQAAQEIFDMLSYSRAEEISYIRYAGAVQDNAYEYELLQLEAAKKYNDEYLNKIENLNNIYKLLISNEEPMTNLQIEDFKSRIRNEGLPPVAVSILTREGLKEEIPSIVEMISNSKPELYKDPSLIFEYNSLNAKLRSDISNEYLKEIVNVSVDNLGQTVSYANISEIEKINELNSSIHSGLNKGYASPELRENIQTMLNISYDLVINTKNSNYLDYYSSAQAAWLEYLSLPGYYKVEFLSPVNEELVEQHPSDTLQIIYTANNKETGEFVLDDTSRVIITNSIGLQLFSFVVGEGKNNIEINPEYKIYSISIPIKDPSFEVGENYSILATFGETEHLKGFALTHFKLVDKHSPASIYNLQSINSNTWINWTWTSPTDSDFNHTEIYLNGIFQTNTSAEYFNATGLEPETDYTIGTRTVDINGNVNETWVNATAKTGSLPDTDSPVIESVILFPTSTTTGSTINVTVNVTDNVGVSGVKANDIPLLNQGGSIWNGSITAIEGTHFVNVSAVDEAGNTAVDKSASYTATTPDTEVPVIKSVSLSNSTPDTGDSIVVTVDVTDNVGVSSVAASGVALANTGGNIWEGSIVAEEGTHKVSVTASDASGNSAVDESASYTAPTPDKEAPVINSVSLSSSTPDTGDSIVVTVDVTDNVGVRSVAASGVALANTGGNIWKGRIVAEEGTHKVSVTASDASGNTAVDKSATYTATTPDTEAPVINSVSLRSSTPDTGDSIVVTVDVTDNVGVRSVAASGVALANTGGNVWEGSIVAEEGTRTVSVTASDASGNTAVDKSARYTATTPDTEAPVIKSVSLSSRTPNTGDSIVVTVDVTDNVGVRSVAASGVALANTGGNVWKGSIVAEEGTHTVSVTASDASGNTAVDKSASYTATTPDTEAPVIKSVSLSSSTPDTGDSIVVTVDVTDNVGVRSVAASGVALVNTGGNVWEGCIVAEEGTHTVSVTTVDEAGNVALDNSTSYTALTPYNLPHSSITNLQSTTGNNWVNWTWQNPLETDFNHTEIYLDGIFQTSTSAEYFNATGLEPETSYTIGTRTVDINGNVNETWVNATAITKEKDSSVISDPGSDGSSSGGSGSSGNGGGACSPEPAKNVEVKELSQQFITNGKPVKFLFPKNVTCITYVEFDSKRTLGKITTIVEMLKGKSAIVSELPEGKVYKNVNIWVGNKETASPKNIENAVVGFKVEKSWVAGGVDDSSIALYRYSDKTWGELVTRQVGEDDKYLYFEAETPGFSPFSIVAPGVDSLNEKEDNKSPSSVEGSYIENIGMDGNQSSESGITGLESAEKGSETGSKSKVLISIGLLSISLLVGYMVLRKQN